MTCPNCGSLLEGLGTFCHECERYTDTSPVEQAEPVGALRLPLPPSVNACWRSIGFMRDGKPAARVVLSTQGRAFKADAAAMLATQRTELHTGRVAMVVVVYFPARRGDLDNRLKPLLDVLEGVCFVNDSQVDAITITRALDREDPRAEVTITELEN